MKRNGIEGAGCCADCIYCYVDPELDKVDPDPWVCRLLNERTDPENLCFAVGVVQD